ncbi:MAG: SCO family protein [Pseudomonadota bacterium]
MTLYSVPAPYGLWRRVYAGALLAIFCCVAVPAAALETAAPALSPALDQATALRASQAVVGRAIGDYTLLDREGRSVRLSSYRGKPLLVSFIYTGCFQICPTTTRALQLAASVARDALGAGRFNVISIGFNQPADTPQALKSFAAQYGINSPNWEFLSPPAAIVPDLARDFGFGFVATAAGFDHLLQVSVVDAEGRIYRQIYGENYSADFLTEPLRQLIAGTPVADATSFSEIFEQVRILCSVYDPRTGKYRVSYAIVLELAGGATFLLWVLWFFLNEWWTRRRSARRSRA